MTTTAAPRPRSVVVFRALVLGDMLCAVPALRALRATLPDAHIAWVGLPSMAWFADRFPRYIDEFIAFPGAPGFPEQSESGEALPPFLAAMRRRRFDLAIQLHGSGGDGNALVAQFGASTMAGFHRPEAGDAWHDGIFVDWDAEVAEPRRYLALMKALGATHDVANDASFELPVLAHERAEWSRLRDAEGLRGADIVCLHAGARWPSRRWPLERFVETGLALAGRGARIVLTGSAEERDLVADLDDTLRRRGVIATNVAGRTSLGALACLLRDARLLICNDTGISHVAAAVGARSVVVASGSDVARWAPLDTGRHRVLAHQVPCRPCMYRDCPIDHPCATGVTVRTVVAHALAQAMPPEMPHAA